MASKSLLKTHSEKETSKPKEDTSWIVEGIVAYLRSPTWTAPVLNFIEDNCREFVDVEENKFDHTEIQMNYKKMVERLLAVYMKELGITEKQFSEACSINNKDIVNADNKFEFIWAADDFLLFKRLMIKYNAEVQREALMMLEKQNMGKFDSCFGEEEAEAMNRKLKKSKRSLIKDRNLKKQEEQDMQLAIQFSKMEMERLNGIVEEERRLIEEAIRLSLSSSSQSGSKPSTDSSSTALTKPVQIGNSYQLPQGFTASSLEGPPSYSEPEKKVTTATIHHSKPVRSQPVTKQKSVDNSSASTRDLPPLKTQKDISSSDAAQAWLDSAMKGITEPPVNSENASDKKVGSIDPGELAKRKAYLKEQRDKLIAFKKKERNKQLSEYNEQEERSSDTVSTSATKQPVSEEEEKRLASRRSVAERLKREVINKN